MEFGEQIKQNSPGLTFLPFGDIDAGGFYIHDHLCRMTGIEFDMYYMSSGELADRHRKLMELPDAGCWNL